MTGVDDISGIGRLQKGPVSVQVEEVRRGIYEVRVVLEKGTKASILVDGNASVELRDGRDPIKIGSSGRNASQVNTSGGNHGDIDISGVGGGNRRAIRPSWRQRMRPGHTNERDDIDDDPIDIQFT
jgi:hypothetical protein